MLIKLSLIFHLSNDRFLSNYYTDSFKNNDTNEEIK